MNEPILESLATYFYEQLQKAHPYYTIKLIETAIYLSQSDRMVDVVEFNEDGIFLVASHSQYDYADPNLFEKALNTIKEHAEWTNPKIRDPSPGKS